MAYHLSAIQAPTLVIAGVLDFATPLGVHEFIRNNIAGAQLMTLPTAHLSNIERPETYTATALRFLLSVSKVMPQYEQSDAQGA